MEPLLSNLNFPNLTINQMFNFISTKTNSPSSHTHSESSSPPQSSLSRFDPTNFTNQGTNTILAPPKALTSALSYTPTSSVSRAASPIKYSVYEHSSTEPPAAEHQLRRPPAPPFEHNRSASHKETFNPVSYYSSFKDIDFSLSAENSPLPSPTKEHCSILPHFNDTKTVDASHIVKRGRLADWFKGESEAINIGIIPSPTKEKVDPLESMWSQSTNKSQPKVAPTSAPRPSAPSTSRFSFFASKPCQPPQPPVNTDDEFAHLDIKAALQPGGQSDPFSPSSFKNLLQNAEGLLSRLQTAYKQRTLTLQEVKAEKDAQLEELEQAQIKARHLKIQLDNMTTKLAEQDKAMMDMVVELATEKEARRNEEDVRKRTIRLVDATMEDLSCQGSFHPRQYRVSRASTVSDSGFESDEESFADSLFSKQQGTSSPTISVTTSSMSSPEVHQDSEFSPFARTSSRGQLRLKATHAMTQTSAPRSTIIQKEQCENCEGVRASEAWNIVGILKEENMCLKERVGHLEGEVDGCLDLVRGFGI